MQAQHWNEAQVIFELDHQTAEWESAKCKSYRMINYMKYEKCDTIDSETRGHPLCHLSFVSISEREGFAENPPFERIQIRNWVSFFSLFVWRHNQTWKKNTDKYKYRAKNFCRLHIFRKKLFWQIKRYPRHINPG